MKKVERHVLLPPLLLCAIIVLSYLLIVREVDGVLQLIHELAVQEQTVSDPTELNNEISRVLRGNKKLAETIDSLRTELISFDEQSDIIQSLSVHAGKHGLRIEKLKPLPALREQQLERISIELTVKGEFAQLLGFTFSLENQARCYLRTFSICALPKVGGHLLAEIKLDAAIE